MPRRRRNDPLGLPDHPNLVTDPQREAELANEVRRKIEYLCRSYRIEELLGLGHASFNAGLVELRKAMRSSPPDMTVLKRLSPWLRFAIDNRTREFASLSDAELLGPEHEDFRLQAAMYVATHAKCIRGKTGRDRLRRYVEGAMALIQEATGKPVMGPKNDKDGNYDPHLTGLAGHTIRYVVDMLEPGVTDSEITYWIRETRKKFVGKPMRFARLFPGYEIHAGIADGRAIVVHHPGPQLEAVAA